MSRQRIRTGVLEGSTVPCPHCAGAGTVRSTASIALHVLRVLEDALIKSSAHDITVRTRTVVALYILNQKRTHLQALEHRFGVAITVAADDSLTGTSYHSLERGEPASGVRELPAAQQPMRAGAPPIDLDEEEIEEAPEPAIEEESEDARRAHGARHRAASAAAPRRGQRQPAAVAAPAASTGPWRRRRGNVPAGRRAAFGRRAGDGRRDRRRAGA